MHSQVKHLVCRLQGIKFTPVATGQPQGNGVVERKDQTVLDAMTIICNGIGKSWTRYVGEVEYALNTKISNTTKQPSYELVYGERPLGPIYIDMLQNWEQETEGKKALENLR